MKRLLPKKCAVQHACCGNCTARREMWIAARVRDKFMSNFWRAALTSGVKRWRSQVVLKRPATFHMEVLSCALFGTPDSP